MVAMATPEPLFQLIQLLAAPDIQLSARSECGRRQLLAFVTGSGHLSLYYVPCPGQLPVLKVVPWFLETTKRIAALSFDPSGTWLLVAGHDGTLYIVPALSLVDPTASSDHRWSTSDVTTFATNLCSPLSSALSSTSSIPASPNVGRTTASASTSTSSSLYQQNVRITRPTCVAWWQCVTDCQHVAIVGTDRGDIVFVSLTAGVQVGLTYIRSHISAVQVCQDNSMDNVFLLITNDQRSQWKLLLEQRSSGYIWPLENVQNKATDLSGGSHSSQELEYSTRNGAALPTTRSRLQGLKQLSVEKLASLKQRLADTRSKGAKDRDVRGRRGSSGSSSDESQARTRKTSVSSDGSDRSSTGPLPDRLSVHVGETFLQPQYARGRYLLSGFYAPNNVLTIHGMSLEVVPLFVYKLAPQTGNVLVTDRFLFVTDTSAKKLSVVSCPFSEGRLDGDSDYNPDAVIETFPFLEDEQILSVYKRTDPTAKPAPRHHGRPSAEPGGRAGRERERGEPRKPFALPKDVGDLDVEERPVDTCVVVTTAGIYEVALRRPTVELFMDMVLKRQELEEAEKLAQIFGLDLQRLLELAGDLMLAGKHFPQSIALYKLSRCRHLKSVLKFAAAGYSKELLNYVTMLFQTAIGELSPSERIHLANLAVMAFTDQVLKAVKAAKKVLLKQFLKFLQSNLNYDEVLAVNVAGQTGLWEVLQFLANQRSLHTEVLDILTKILKSLTDLIKDRESVVDRSSPALDSGLWLCVSSPSLLQSLLANPKLARTHLTFVSHCLPLLELFVLERLAALLDPSSPVARPPMRRLLATGRRRQTSTVSTDLDSDSCDLSETGSNEEFSGTAIVEEVLQLFIAVLLHLGRRRSPSPRFDRHLMDRVQLPSGEDEDLDLSLDLVPLQTTTVGAGFCHAALVRNGTVFTWGNAVQGCLGTGPTMSRYSGPQHIYLFGSLKIEVFSVSCGRQHTLALTSNGVYSWGSNQFGQLGVGKVGQSSWPLLVEGLARERVVAISAGQYHSLALTGDGRVYSWGWGVHGQLGHGSIEDCKTPKLIKALMGLCVKQISAGHGHTLVLSLEGEIYSFGSSIFGQLGRGTNTKSSVPVKVEGIADPVINIATNYFHNLAVTSSNRLYIWGASPQVLRLQAQAQKKARLLQQQSAQTPTADTARTPSFDGSPSPKEEAASKAVGSPEAASVSSPGSGPPAGNNGDVPTDDAAQNRSLQVMRSNLSVDLDSPVLDLGLNDIVELFHEDETKIDVNNGVEMQNLHNSRADTGVTELAVESLKGSINNNQNLTELDEINQNIGINMAMSEQNARNEDIEVSNTLTKKSFTQSVQDYFNEHTMSLTDSSLNTHTNNTANKNRNDNAGTELSNLSEKWTTESDNSNKPPQSQNGREANANVALANGPSLKDDCVKCDSLLKPDSRDSTSRVTSSKEARASDSCAVPSVVLSSTRLAFSRQARLSSEPEPSKQPSQTTSKIMKKRPVVIADDGGQTHLSPQLVNTSLVNGPIVKIACGCHHSALISKEGVLYMWGRNLDGQLGTGSRREVLVPSPVFSFVAASANAQGDGYTRGGIANVIPPACELRRVQEVACGCEFTIVVDGQSSKLWAWGSNSLAQLGKPPMDDTKAIDGKLVMIKTVKRVIKLPHGSQNSCDTPREVPNIPPSGISFRQAPRDVLASRSFLGQLLPLSTIEQPCYGSRTLHYVLQRFHGQYDSAAVIGKCEQLEDFQAAAKIALLDRNYHLALTHQLKALVLSKKSNTMDVADVTGKKAGIKKNVREKGGSITEENCDSQTNHIGNVSNGDAREFDKGLMNGDEFNSSHNGAKELGEGLPVIVEERLEGAGASEAVGGSAGVAMATSQASTPVTSSPESLLSSPTPSEIHAFAIQGGNEEMSEGRQDLSSPSDTASPLSRETNVLDLDYDAGLEPCEAVTTSASPAPPSDSSATAPVPSLNSDAIATRPSELKLTNTLTSVQLSTQEQVVEDKVEENLKLQEESSDLADSPANYHDDDGSDLAVSPVKPVREPAVALDEAVVAQAAEIVEHYIAEMEDDSHATTSRLLKHGLDFWLDHALPVERLESLLLRHMTRFFYPLGLLLFNPAAGKDGDEPDTMLNRLSTRFCLQLCSTLLMHINQRKPHPEYVELLANVTSLQISPTAGVNGSYFTCQGSSHSQEQLVEAILARLGGATTIPYVNIQEQAIASCINDQHSPSRLYTFSCGHNYSSSDIHQDALPEVERALPNTARILKTLFESSPHGGRLACPRCVLAHVTSLPAP